MSVWVYLQQWVQDTHRGTALDISKALHKEDEKHIVRQAFKYHVTQSVKLWVQVSSLHVSPLPSDASNSK